MFVRANTMRISAAFLVCLSGVFGSRGLNAGIAQTEPSQRPAGVIRTYNTPFDPAQQTPITATKGDIEIRLAGIERCARCTSAYQLTLEVANRAQGRTRRFDITDGPAQIDEIHIIDDLHAVIVGRVQATINSVVLLDISSGAVNDKLLCFYPSVSPDGTRIAYVKVYPIHFMENVSNEYLIYDLSRSPADNRNAGIAGNDDTNVGAAIYPLGSKNVPGDNLNVPSSLSHQLASDGFFWSPDSKKVVFADRTNGSNFLVAVDLSAGVKNPSVAELPLESEKIINRDHCQEYSRKEAYAFNVSKVEFSDASSSVLKLHFNFPIPSCRMVDALTVDLP